MHKYPSGKRTLNLGIVGCGFIASQVHIPLLTKMRDGVRVKCVCDKDEEKARRVAERFYIGRYYKRVSDMLKKEKLDVVDICTPTSTHVPIAIQAMDEGCHVIVEKPLSISLREAEEAIKAAKKNGVKLCVGHNSSFNAACRKAKQLVESGDVGEVVSVEAKLLGRKTGMLLDKDNWVHRLLGGMITFETGPHPVWLVLTYMHTVQNVYAIAKKFGNLPWVLADELNISLKGDILGAVTVSYNSPIDVSILEIHGTEAILYVDIFSQIVMKFKPSRLGHERASRVCRNISSSIQRLSGLASTMTKSLLGKVKTGHEFLLPEFIQSIQKNTSPPVNVEKARELVRILEDVATQVEANLGQKLGQTGLQMMQ